MNDKEREEKRKRELERTRRKMEQEKQDLIQQGEIPQESVSFFSFRAKLIEKTLTPAEKKKREEVAKAIERDQPGMPMAKKMAIATATAKKVAEENLLEAKRIVSTHGSGVHTAKVYRDPEHNEFQVHFFKNGKHMGEGPVSYHDDKEDAQSTADSETKRMNSRVNEEVHPDALHVKPVKVEGKTKYKVHAVGSNFSHGVKVGEHLSDSELDDFSEMGGKVKHVNEAETSKLYNYAFDKYADITSGKNKKDKEKASSYERIARNAFKMGISRPMKKPNLPEEVESLDELDKSTLSSYADKAKKDIKAKKAEFIAQGGEMRKKSQRALDAKISNRYKGLFTAQRKAGFKEEVESLDELKRSTLASYTGKAADQMAHAAIDKASGAAMGAMGRMSNMPDLAKKGSEKEDKAFKTILNRSRGIAAASRRLAREEVEMDEAIEDRIYDKGHSPERLQQTVDKAREHEKSYFKKRADSFFKPTDYESRRKEDSRLQRVRRVMHAASAAKQYATDTAPKPFTGRIGRKY